MREFRTSGSVGAPGEQSPGATRSLLSRIRGRNSGAAARCHAEIKVLLARPTGLLHRPEPAPPASAHKSLHTRIASSVAA